MKAKVKRGWKAFQKRQGISVDGDPGGETLAAVVGLEACLKDPQRNAVRIVGQLISGTVDRRAADMLTRPGRLRTYSYGGEAIKAGLFRNPADLIPAFADRIELLFKHIRAQGFDPLLWEAYRSPVRAAKLAKKGTGIRKSMHCLGAAVDIVEADLTPWNVPAGFWDAISDGAKSLGLVTLYRNGKHRDRPHVQALPVSMQSKFRRMTNAQRVAYVTKRLAT